MQEIMLTSDNLSEDIGDNLLKIYEELVTLEDKLQYVSDLKTCMINQTVVENLSKLNHRFLLELSIRLCISVLHRSGLYANHPCRRTHRERSL